MIYYTAQEINKKNGLTLNAVLHYMLALQKNYIKIGMRLSLYDKLFNFA